ncbi:MAG TPA: RNA polymerase sigma factor [bacterium]|nr:RNA polymerase sigma factor [bacterium]
METGENRLIEAILQGNPGSRGEVLRLYGPEVYWLAYSRLWNMEEARDVLQECIFHLMEEVRNGQFRAGSGSIRAFLRTTAGNLCIDRIRSKDRFRLRKDEIRDFEVLRRNAKNPGDVAEENDIQEAIRGGLPQLTELQRAAFVLHYLDGVSVGEIAERLGLSENNVRNHLWRARQRMRVILARFVEE